MQNSTSMREAGWLSLASIQFLPFSLIFAGGVVLHAINVFISATILPSVVREIGGMAYYAWSTTLFTVCSIVSAALSARLVARLGARDAYLTAFAVFALGTMICGSANSILWLNFGRAVQGLGGGALYALSYIVIRMVFPHELRAHAVGLISLMWGVATLCGPAIGGVFADMGQWRMAFWSLLPVITSIALMAFAVLPGEGRRNVGMETIPYPQLGSLVAIVVLLSAAGSVEQVSLTITLITAAFVSWAWLLRNERTSRARLLPCGSLTRRNPLGRIYLFGALMIVGMQPELYVPFFAQELFGQPPLRSGYIGAIMALGWTLGTIISAGYSGEKADRTSAQGSLVSSLGLVMASAVLAGFISGPVALTAFCIGLAFVGFGIGYCWPHVTTAVYALAPEGEDEIAAGGLTTIQLFATAVGAALAGLVVNAGLVVGDVGMAAPLLFGLFALSPVLAYSIRKTTRAPS